VPYRSLLTCAFILESAPKWATLGYRINKAKKHDQVDTTTQAFNYFRGSGPSGIELYYKEEFEKKVAREAEAADEETEQTKAQVPG
jgi:hypothetical protein